VNRNSCPRNKAVQLSTPYSDPEHHNTFLFMFRAYSINNNTHCHGQTDRRTDGKQTDR